MAKIVTIGSVCQDIFFPTGEGVLMETPNDTLSQKKLAFELGGKCAIEERFESLGGNSVNVAVGLAKLGENVSAYTTIGDDMIGAWIMKKLQKTNVGSEYIRKEMDCKSDLSAIVVDNNSADRIIFSSHVANKKLVFEARKIENPNWIFIGDLSGDWQKIIDEIIDIAQEKKILLAFNPRQVTIHEDVKKIIYTISKCEILFLNKDEAIEVVSGFGEIIVRELLENEEYLLKILHRFGAKIVIITDGIMGAWGYRGGEIIHVDAILQKAVDSTGAGDAFTSGFFAAHLKGLNLETSLKWGIANSSNSVTEYGGQLGLLNEQQVNELIKKI